MGPGAASSAQKLQWATYLEFREKLVAWGPETSQPPSEGILLH